MTDHVVTISQNEPIQTAAAMMIEYKESCLVVMNGAKPVGILTDRDFVLLGVNGNAFKKKTLIKEIIKGQLVTINSQAKFSEAFTVLNRYGFKQIPVVERGKLLGILTLRQMLVYSRNLVIESLEENKSLRREIYMDSLTGVYNKRYLNKRIKKEYSKVGRYGIRSSLIFLDIDHFKKINDNYSHEAGDYILKSIGRIIKKQVKKSDIVFRYGGEEFIIITPYSSSPEAAVLAHKIRKTIEGTSFRFLKNNFKITVSAGAASISSSNSSSQALDRADKAMYYSKELGRNRVCRWSDSKDTVIEVPYINIPQKNKTRH